MHKYEYVSRKEYQPVRQELEEIIRKVHHYMREKYDFTFQHRLIGSGKRHLITRKINGNQGFDFDYNFIIPHPGTGYSWKGEVIKDQFMEALKLALRGTKYSVCENSTSVITIKVVDRKKSKIEHSCDFAIIYYPKNEIFDGYYYLKRLKSLNCYCFEKRSVASRVDEKLEYILKYDNGWNRIKEEYLKLKNSNNDPDKHSFALYLEAVNNVYNQLKPSYSLGFIRLN